MLITVFLQDSSNDNERPPISQRQFCKQTLLPSFLQPSPSPLDAIGAPKADAVELSFDDCSSGLSGQPLRSSVDLPPYSDLLCICHMDIVRPRDYPTWKRFVGIIFPAPHAAPNTKAILPQLLIRTTFLGIRTRIPTLLKTSSNPFVTTQGFLFSCPFRTQPYTVWLPLCKTSFHYWT